MISELLLPEFDDEMAKTRLVLERLPEEKLDWAPHEKSFPLGHLAAHVATMVGLWGTTTLLQDGYDLAVVERPAPPASRAALLDAFDAGVAALRAALAATSDEAFGQSWSLSMAGHVFFTLPRYTVFRSMVLNHLFHHRAQLGVYLRLLDVPVPGIYGPTADEQPPMG
jgi:uncharacterized damage-inducible protein DinB